jgi:hypothetical protein
MEIKNNFGLKPVDETISIDEKVDVPLYKQPGSYNNYKPRVGVTLKGVGNADKILRNESDYTRGE